MEVAQQRFPSPLVHKHIHHHNLVSVELVQILVYTLLVFKQSSVIYQCGFGHLLQVPGEIDVQGWIAELVDGDVQGAWWFDPELLCIIH